MPVEVSGPLSATEGQGGSRTVAHPTLTFARHETFHVRDGWLFKGLQAVQADSQALYAKDAHHSLGLGINMLLSMLDGVYFDTKGEKALVAIKPKPAFMPIFQVAVARKGSDVVLIKEPPGDSQEAHTAPCSWWRRGGVEPPVQKTPHWNVLQACPALNFSPYRTSAGEDPVRPADRSWVRLIGVGKTAPRFIAPVPRPRGETGTDVAALGG